MKQFDFALVPAMSVFLAVAFCLPQQRKQTMTASVKIIHGPNDDIFDLPDGTTVFSVSRNLSDAFNIPATAASFVNGELVFDDFRLRHNDILEFILPWGQKGAAAYTSISGGNSDLMLTVSGLYFQEGNRIADVTYGNGVFWRKVDVSIFQFFPSDIVTCPQAAFDFRALPYSDNSFDVHVFDPPYMHHPAKKSYVEGSYRNHETTAGMSHKDIINLYREGMKEGVRILRPGGLMLVKCQDEIESSKQRWSHIEIFEIAGHEMGMTVQDLFVLTPKSLPMIRYLNQKHARKNHSYLWVFKKASK